MLSDREFSSYCGDLGLPASTVRLIKSIRQSDPARSVGDHALHNMRCRMASMKMGHTVTVESRTCELPFAIRKELNHHVLEFWAQPSTFSIERRINGRRHVSPYTPDFLVLAKKSFGLFECKPCHKLVELCINKPSDWSNTGDVFRFAPADSTFAKLDVPFHVWSAPNRAGILNANLETLLALRYCVLAPNSEKLLEKVRRLLKNGSMAISEICRSISGVDESLLIHWIATADLFACTQAQLLWHGLTTHVFSRGEEAREREALLISNGNFDGSPSKPITTSRVLAASPVDLARGLERLKLLQPVLDGLRPATRHERRTLPAVRAAMAIGENPLEALITNTASRGNRNVRLPDQVFVVKSVIGKVLDDGQKLSPTAVLAKVNPLLDQKGLDRVGYETVRAHCKSERKEHIAMVLGGKRAYHKERPRTDPYDATMRCEIPGLIAHIDSSQWDQRLWERMPFSKDWPCPWWYVAYDEASEKAIGVSIALGKADRFGLSLLMRDIGETIGFLPHFVVKDRGSENGSAWSQMFDAELGVNALDRSAGNPRSGSTVENGIGIATKQFAQKLLGSTELDKAGRKVDGNKKSKAFACYSLALANEGLRSYLSDHYDTTPHGTRDGSPNDIWARGRITHPHIGRPLPDRNSWDILTAVPIRERVRVDINKGVRTYYRAYTSSEFIAQLRKQQPDDLRLSAAVPTIIYAKFGSLWVPAYSQDHLSQSTLPLGHQSAELFVRRLLASVNKSARQKANERLDVRVDQLNHTAKLKKQSAETKSELEIVAIEDYFSTINWDYS
jgi:putative transposase